MNEIQIFENPEFGQVRTLIAEDGEPRFCLTDVCNALELTAGKVAQRLEDGMLSKHPVIDSLGKKNTALFVNEEGLYDTIFDSRKPIAKKFRKWVTSEVLPSIRKTGTYTVAANYTAIVKADPQIDAQQAALGMTVTRNVLENIASLYNSLTNCGQRDYCDYIILSSLPARHSEVARDYGMSESELQDALVTAGVMSKYYKSTRCCYCYELAPDFRERGYTAGSMEEALRGDSPHYANVFNVWTVKGRLMIYAKLSCIGILPILDQNKQRMAAIAKSTPY